MHLILTALLGFTGTSASTDRSARGTSGGRRVGNVRIRDAVRVRVFGFGYSYVVSIVISILCVSVFSIIIDSNNIAKCMKVECNINRCSPLAARHVHANRSRFACIHLYE